LHKNPFSGHTLPYKPALVTNISRYRLFNPTKESVLSPSTGVAIIVMYERNTIVFYIKMHPGMR
jgi:hypothetical protein